MIGTLTALQFGIFDTVMGSLGASKFHFHNPDEKAWLICWNNSKNKKHFFLRTKQKTTHYMQVWRDHSNTVYTQQLTNIQKGKMQDVSSSQQQQQQHFFHSVASQKKHSQYFCTAISAIKSTHLSSHIHPLCSSYYHHIHSSFR